MAASKNNSIRLEYDNADYPVAVIYMDLSANRLLDSRWQWHEDIEILIINNGTAEIKSDDQTIRLLPGQALLIGQNVMHYIKQFGDEPCSFYSIIFHTDFILGSHGNPVFDIYATLLEDNNTRFMIFDENVSWHSELIDLLNSAIAINMLKSTGYEVATRGYLCMFWSLLAARINDDTSASLAESSSSIDEQRVKSAMSYIRDHHAEKIELDDIALEIHVSKSECCRCFKRSIGITPFEYLMRYRIFRAGSLLVDPEHATESVADIAFAVGFNNLSYFSKLFKKYMNSTPRQYRKDQRHHNPNIDLMSLR